jgi:hypothetical protein
LGDVVNMAGGDGGKLKTNLDNYTQLIDGLCYKKCPDGHVDNGDLTACWKTTCR